MEKEGMEMEAVMELNETAGGPPRATVGGIAVKGKRGFQVRTDKEDNLVSMVTGLMNLQVEEFLTVSLSTTQVAITIRVLEAAVGRKFVRRMIGGKQVIARVA